MQEPRPLIFAPSQLWHGNDGSWSSFILRVGTPEQNFRVLPSSATGELIIPHAVGCQPSNGDPAECAELRGVFDTNRQGFLPNASTTWKEVGFYGMGLESKLGYADDALYGTDTVGLMIQNSGGPTLGNQLIGAVRQMPFFIGLFGLSPEARNFTNFEHPQRSFLTPLKHERQIPSLSYAYNAGAYYSNSLFQSFDVVLTDPGTPKVFGSLTLGGFDQNRFEPNNFTFPFDQDDTQLTSLKLQQITAEHTFNGSVVLLQEETYVNLDFTMPYLWLPRDVCDRIAAFFKLEYDNTTELYLVDDTTHQDLLARNPSFTFAFGESPSLVDTVSIELMYAAFDLQASWPIYNESKNYFPIRRTTNASQYTLGRAFMQEAYVIVDFERRNFSLHQAAFPASNQVKLVSIPAKGTEKHEAAHGLDQGSIAGIVTGSTVFVVLLVMLAALLCYRKKRRSPKEQRNVELCISSEKHSVTTELPDNKTMRMEMMSTEVLELQSSREEVEGRPRYELA